MRKRLEWPCHVELQWHFLERRHLLEQHVLDLELHHVLERQVLERQHVLERHVLERHVLDWHVLERHVLEQHVLGRHVLERHVLVLERQVLQLQREVLEQSVLGLSSMTPTDACCSLCGLSSPACRKACNMGPRSYSTQHEPVATANSVPLPTMVASYGSQKRGSSELASSVQKPVWLCCRLYGLDMTVGGLCYIFVI